MECNELFVQHVDTAVWESERKSALFHHPADMT